jgi:RNA polymerase sigma factor (TIGR02999 family)
MAARVMRQILVDHARRKQAHKRGGGKAAITLDEPPLADSGMSLIDVLALDEALTEMTVLEPRMCQVVELRFFAGLNTDEAADALNVSTATVERDWTLAKAWLLRRLSPPGTR